MGNYPFGPPGDTIIEYLAPSGDTTGAKDAQNILNAVAAAPATGGVITLAATGTWYIECGQVIINKTGVYIDATACYIKAVGAGDMIRMYDSSAYSGRNPLGGGGILGMPVIDGSLTTGNASAIHAGDILQLAMFVQPQNFTAGTTSKGVWLDNNYYWTEQCYGRIYASNCTTNVMLDNSTGTSLSASATGSFDRLVMDIFVNQNGSGDGVTFNNGAFVIDGELSILGNFAYNAATAYAVLKLEGSNGGGGSKIENSILNILAELDGSGTVAPYTISMTGSPFTFIQTCQGIMDFSASAAFQGAPHNAGNFRYAGTVLGDNVLAAMPYVTAAVSNVNVTGNGQEFFILWFPVIEASGGSSSYTGLIIEAGGFNGQPLTLVNVGTGSFTFAAQATSNVAGGASIVIAGGTAATFTWLSDVSLWWRSV